MCGCIDMHIYIYPWWSGLGERFFFNRWLFLPICLFFSFWTFCIGLFLGCRIDQIAVYWDSRSLVPKCNNYWFSIHYDFCGFLTVSPFHVNRFVRIMFQGVFVFFCGLLHQWFMSWFCFGPWAHTRDLCLFQICFWGCLRIVKICGPRINNLPYEITTKHRCIEHLYQPFSQTETSAVSMTKQSIWNRPLQVLGTHQHV